MTTTVPDLTIRQYDASGLHAQRDQLLAVYAEVYADELHDPFFSVDRFWERLEGYASRDGFSLVTGSLDGEMVGYALGYTLPVGANWWRGLQTEVDPDVLEEDGRRTFAVTEVMVREGWRRRGYAKALHDVLLDDRSEERATLLVEPDNIPARTAYLSWGWHKVGDLQPYPDAPVYEAMLLSLK